jgi:hypothetical protein
MNCPHSGDGWCLACVRRLSDEVDMHAALANRLNRESLKIHDAVREHYRQRGDNRCHLDDLKLYHEVLGFEPDPYVTALPPEADMLESCRRYAAQRQHPECRGKYPMPGGMTIAQLTEKVEAGNRLRDAIHEFTAAMEKGRVGGAAFAQVPALRRINATICRALDAYAAAGRTDEPEPPIDGPCRHPVAIETMPPKCEDCGKVLTDEEYARSGGSK